MLFNVMLTISGRFAKDDVWSRSMEFWDIEIVFNFNNDVRSRLGTSWKRLLSKYGLFNYVYEIYYQV